MNDQKPVDQKEAVRIGNAALSAATLLKDLGRQARDAGMGDLGYYAEDASKNLVQAVIAVPGVKLVLFPVKEEEK